MGMTQEELSLLISLRDEASAALRSIQGEVRDLGMVTDDVKGRGGGFFSGMLQSATGFLAANVVGAITSQIGGFFSGIVSEASDAADGAAQLSAVLESTGGVAGMTRDAVLDLSSALSAANGLSKFSDDAVLAAENLLLTFTNIGQDVFPDATQVMVDMATAMKTDVSAQAIALGKALNDPIQGITALTRVGVNFTEEQKALIQSLVESGNVAEAQRIIIAELTREFGGSAAAAANTFSGKLAQLQERFAGLQQEIGDQVVPELENALDVLNSPDVQASLEELATLFGQTLAGAIRFVAETALPALISGWHAIEPAVRGAVFMLQTGIEVLQMLGGVASGWGENITYQFAGGIIEGAGAVVEALGYIGEIVTSWLQPGSPPRLLPDLDLWGAEAAAVYAEGWTREDFSTFRELGDALKGALQSMADAGLNGVEKQDIIPILFGSRDALSRALNELRDLGSVSEETFQDIIQAAGPAGPQIEGIVRAYFDLERATADVRTAQDELNRVTQEYQDQLSPLQGELKAIQDRGDELRDMKRVQELQKVIADEKTSDLDRQIAQNEIEEIQARNRVDAVEAERDAAVDAAKAKVDAAKREEQAAQTRMQAQQSTLDLFEQNNQLIAEQTRLIEQLAKQEEQKAKAGAGGGGGPSIAPPVIPRASLPEAPTKDIDDLSMLQEAAIEGQRIFNEVSATLQQMGSQWQATFAQLQEDAAPAIAAVMPYIESAQMQLTDFGQETLPMLQQAWLVLSTGVMTIVAALVSGIQQNWGSIQQSIGLTMQLIVAIVQTGWDLIKGVVQVVLQLLGGDIGGAWESFQQLIADALVNIATIVLVGFELAKHNAITMLTILQDTGSGIWDKIKDGVSVVIEAIQKTVFDGLDSLSTNFFDTLDSMATSVLDAVSDFKKNAESLGKGVIDGIVAGIQNGLGFLGETIKHAAEDALAEAKEALGISSPSRVAALEVGLPFAQGIAQGVAAGAPVVQQSAFDLAAMMVSFPAFNPAQPAFAGAGQGAPTAEPITRQPVIFQIDGLTILEAIVETRGRDLVRILVDRLNSEVD